MLPGLPQAAEKEKEQPPAMKQNLSSKTTKRQENKNPEISLTTHRQK